MKLLLALLVVAGSLIAQNAAPMVKAGASQTIPASGTEKVVTLSWVHSTSIDVAGYNIYRSLSQTARGVRVTPAPIYAVSFLDQGLGAGTYYYVATAVNFAGLESVPSNQVTTVIQ
jgi:hypothetical protein